MRWAWIVAAAMLAGCGAAPAFESVSGSVDTFPDFDLPETWTVSVIPRDGRFPIVRDTEAPSDFLNEAYGSAGTRSDTVVVAVLDDPSSDKPIIVTRWLTWSLSPTPPQSQLPVEQFDVVDDALFSFAGDSTAPLDAFEKLVAPIEVDGDPSFAWTGELPAGVEQTSPPQFLDGAFSPQVSGFWNEVGGFTAEVVPAPAAVAMYGPWTAVPFGASSAVVTFEGQDAFFSEVNGYLHLAIPLDARTSLSVGAVGMDRQEMFRAAGLIELVDKAVWEDRYGPFMFDPEPQQFSIEQALSD